MQVSCSGGAKPAHRPPKAAEGAGCGLWPVGKRRRLQIREGRAEDDDVCTARWVEHDQHYDVSDRRSARQQDAAGTVVEAESSRLAAITCCPCVQEPLGPRVRVRQSAHALCQPTGRSGWRPWQAIVQFSAVQSMDNAADACFRVAFGRNSSGGSLGCIPAAAGQSQVCLAPWRP